MSRIRDIKFERKGGTNPGTQRQKGVRGAYESAFAEQQLTKGGLLVKDSHATIQKTLGTDNDVLAAVFSPSKVPESGYVTTSGQFALDSNHASFSSAYASLMGIGVPIFATLELNHLTFVGNQAKAFIALSKGDKRTSNVKALQEDRDFRQVVDIWPVGLVEPEGVAVDASATSEIVRVVNFRFGAGNSSSNKVLQDNIADLDPKGLTRDKWKYPNHPSTALMENVNSVMRRIYDDMQSALMNATGMSTLSVITNNKIEISAAFETIQPKGGLPPLAFNCRIVVQGDRSGDVTRIMQMILAAQVDSMDFNSVKSDLDVINRYHRWLAS